MAFHESKSLVDPDLERFKNNLAAEIVAWQRRNNVDAWNLRNWFAPHCNYGFDDDHGKIRLVRRFNSGSDLVRSQHYARKKLTAASTNGTGVP